MSGAGARAKAARMHRFEVRTKSGRTDPRAAALRREAAAIGIPLEDVRVARLYLVHGALDSKQVNRIAMELLANPVLEDVEQGASSSPSGAVCVEIHPLPGVMDPPARTVEAAIGALIDAHDVEASTGWRYELTGATREQAEGLAKRLLANPVIQAIHFEPFFPGAFPHGEKRPFQLSHVTIRDLSDDELQTLSRDGHLFLSLDEMRAIQTYYRDANREPTDIELETLAQTWSEHCVHKTLKSDVLYRGPKDDIIDWSNRPGHVVQPDGSVKIDNLLKSTVAAATHELIADGLDWTLSVFVDNAGIIAFDDDHAVCVKVETHNHPSAIEPYGGAATGVGGCIRDIMGTGLAAKPIANTDVFCVAYPDGWGDTAQGGAKQLPAGCLHPKRILKQVVAGVRDYGNRMGVPTVSGSVYFDDRYVGNPLVYCGCVGVMPRDKIDGHAKPGDLIVALGGRTGRDGIHGATFSSAELTDTHADEFSHAVQIGNAIEEKKVLDAILRARDHESGTLFRAITDCGAGGFSSAVGEMGEKVGAEVHLERAPLKYDGLTYSEIWISEAQERMVLSVAPDRLEALQEICDEESVELAVLGTFGTPKSELILNFHGNEVGRIGMEFLHDGLPKLTREATWSQSPERQRGVTETSSNAHNVDLNSDVRSTLLNLLSHPNIASKRWIVRQYDHEVQGGAVIKPLVGPNGDGPGDATVIQPVAGSTQGLAISQGLAVPAGDPAAGGDPYLMALEAVDECVRNLVCVGADPSRIAILDNFCWPSCAKPENLASLVRAAEGCYDAAKAYRTPFVSGKDSLNNQFTTEDGRTIEIPPTLLITGIGIVPDVSECVTMDLKGGGPKGSSLFLIGPAPRKALDVAEGVRTANAIHELIRAGLILSAHDVSEGGVAVAAAEMALASGMEGVTLVTDWLAQASETKDTAAALFGEGGSRYLVEVSAKHFDRSTFEGAFRDQMEKSGAKFAGVGFVEPGQKGFSIVPTAGAAKSIAQFDVDELKNAFLGTLDW